MGSSALPGRGKSNKPLALKGLGQVAEWELSGQEGEANLLAEV